jgi:Uma2 family endonuclease
VPEVWIVDIVGSAVETYRQPKGGAYSSAERRISGTLAPELIPGIAIDVATLLA